jgi:hypothetical protein
MVASRLNRFTTKERAPGIHYIDDWVGPKAGLDWVVSRKIPSPFRESNSGRLFSDKSTILGLHTLKFHSCPNS